MKQELLFEIGTEEIPAGFIQPSLVALQELLSAKLSELSLPFNGIRGAATPRRLAVCVQGLENHQPDQLQKIMGPPKKAAFDDKGNPTKAGVGFAQSRGASVDDLRIISTPKGEYVMLEVEQKGSATEALLPEILTGVLNALSFKKSMHWGTGQMHFARPIQWIVALYGGALIEIELENQMKSGRTTRGHRFHSPTPMEVDNFEDYLEKLRQAQVIADPIARRIAVSESVSKAAMHTGGSVIDDQELLDTVTNLVESPYAVCGNFAERFLQLPKEVLITSMREHQKYFAIADKNGRLMAHFVAVNNTRVKDDSVTRAGHERVLRARLEDAFFFFQGDQKTPLVDRVNLLSGVVFQAKLGTLLEKTHRLVELTGFLADLLAPDVKENAQRAAFLAKADLLTGMVGEFPSLQGVMGREYALQQGEKVEVSTAVYQHYLPLRAGGDLPDNIEGILLGLADRLDTIAGCFGIGAVPTGSADPFGLRRLTLAILHIIQNQGFSLSLSHCIKKALALYGDKIDQDHDTTLSKIIEFIKGRFSNDLTGRGIPIETVEAVTSTGFDDIMDCRKKIDALLKISDQPAFTVLAGSFKRVQNIIKGHKATEVNESLLHEDAEKDLFRALQKSTDRCAPLLKNCDYDLALAEILTMKEPVDTFFDHVMVMADDEQLKNNRLAILTGISRLFLQIGDFSRMYALKSKGE